MSIGIDFDNTIVSYDELFHQLASERRLIPSDFPVSKTRIRDLLRAEGQEDIWTELQGLAYGSEIGRARPFPGVIEFVRAASEQGLAVRIISHKTRQPFMGAQTDLHAAARGWLASYDVIGSTGPLRSEHVFLELTRDDKLARIGASGCTTFIDDLPEFLALETFPPRVQRVLFDPAGVHHAPSGMWQMRTWHEIEHRLLRCRLPI
ncbi:MAG: hypothetical protein NVSMB2_01900 [Chloroflexota bacterium]